jgi:hypothetical protein
MRSYSDAVTLSRPAIVRRAVLSALAVCALAMTGAVVVDQPATRLAAATARPAASDFAETAYGQPWDFSDAGQLPYGSTVQNLATGANGLTFTAAKGQQLSLVRTELGAIPWGRDGSAHPIDASTYTRMSIRIKSDVFSAQPGVARGQIFWFSCPTMTQSCEGGSFFDVTSSGWQTIDMPLTNAYSGGGYPAAWSGAIRRLILTPNATSSTAAHMQVAWIRIYQPGQRDYQVQGVPSGATSVTWTRQGGSAADTGTIPASGGRATFPADAYPAGIYDFSVNGTVVDTLHLDQRPLVHWQSPNQYGCVEYSANVRGDAWDMSQPTDVARLLDASNVSYSGGILAATNAGPTQNDPEVWLRLGPALDSHRFYRLRILTRYDGSFGLGGGPGGGTVARVVWGTAQYNTSATWQVSRPIVLYPGWNDVLIDMSDPYNGTSDPSAAESARYTWTQAGQITFLRFDPNEDPGPRRWYVDSVQVFGDCPASGTFPIQLSDTSTQPHGDEQVTVYADSSGTPSGQHGPQVASFTIPAGTGTGGSGTANVSALATGSYRLFAQVTNGSATVGSYAPTPLQVRGGGAVPRSTTNACPPGQVPAAGFTDVDPSSPHAPNINCVVWWQVAHGVSSTSYAPGLVVPRDQMAAFVARLIRAAGGSLPSNPPDKFADDNGDPFEADINALAAVGVVQGSGGRYYPSAPVDRGSMAAYLDRAYTAITGKTLSHPHDYFVDDNGSTFENDINNMAAAGITGGYADGTYRPGVSVTRDQMASFLARELDLLVTNGYAKPPSG